MRILHLEAVHTIVRSGSMTQIPKTALIIWEHFDLPMAAVKIIRTFGPNDGASAREKIIPSFWRVNLWDD
jgi:hypothetical protein